MKYALIGEKLSHSYSKTIHDQIGLYDYDIIEIEKNDVETILKESKYKGFNVTIPYKRIAMSLCDFISDEAAQIGSVNTVIRKSDGRLFGYNTDYHGLLFMLSRAGITLEGKKVAILGSGGTGLTAQAVARAEKAKEIVVVSRSGKAGYDDLKLYNDADILINTTPVGMYPKMDEMPVNPEDFVNCRAVADVIYNPLKTKLLQKAEALGMKTADGLSMLVSQGIMAAELFTNKKLPESILPSILKKLNNDVQNIVLTGMPGCGKTAIGKVISRLSGRRLFDTDEIIEKNTGISIPEIFAKSGEKGFREIEKRVLKEAAAQRGIIIATGGGSVLLEENRNALRQNGRIYFIMRELNLLEKEGRPLSASNESLKKMYESRLPIYKDFADKSINNDSEIEKAAESIWEDFIKDA